MVRRSRADAEQTRWRITAETAQLLSVEGVAGTSLSSVAERLGMSKAGVAGPFRSRDQLLLAAFDHAVSIFQSMVVEPVLSADLPPGESRVALLIDRWISYLVECPFLGGCVFTSVSTDVDGRPGEFRDRVLERTVQWQSFLRSELSRAREAGHTLPANPDDTAMTLVGLSMALNQAVQLLDDSNATARAARLMREAAGL